MAVKLNFKNFNESHFQKIRIENRATRDQENTVRLCKKYNM